MNIDNLPIWGVSLVTILVILAAIEGGYVLGRYAHKRSEDEKESPVSAMTGTVLGLVAFILAFTFGIVSNRFDDRKALVREEANAIRTAWFRSDFLPESDRAEAKALIRKYLDARLQFVQLRDTSPENVEARLSDARQVQAHLWDMAVANARLDMNSDVAALYIESLNEVFAINSSRIALGLQARIPGAIWFMLLATMILGMMGVGYQTGIAGSRRSLARPILALSFALVIALIASLDRPNSGVISVSQQPLIDLQNQIGEPERASSAAVSQSPNRKGWPK